MLALRKSRKRPRFIDLEARELETESLCKRASKKIKSLFKNWTWGSYHSVVTPYDVVDTVTERLPQEHSSSSVTAPRKSTSDYSFMNTYERKFSRDSVYSNPQSRPRIFPKDTEKHDEKFVPPQRSYKEQSLRGLELSYEHEKDYDLATLRSLGEKYQEEKYNWRVDKIKSVYPGETEDERDPEETEDEQDEGNFRSSLEADNIRDSGKGYGVVSETQNEISAIANVLKNMALDSYRHRSEVYNDLVQATLCPPHIREQAAKEFDSMLKTLILGILMKAKGTAPLSRKDSGDAEDLIYETRGGEVIVKKFNYDIQGKDFHTLRDGEWLNDEIINFHLELFKERMKRNLNDPQVPREHRVRCIFFNTFFYTKLSDNWRGYKYRSVRRWSKKQHRQVHESQVDKVIIPINVNNNHWCLAVINFQKKRFEYYDSLGGRNRSCLENLKKYVIDEHKNYRKEDVALEDWEFVHPQDIPHQRNGCDCGVFTTQYADHLSENRQLSFSQADMPAFRRKMALAIKNVKVL